MFDVKCLGLSVVMSVLWIGQAFSQEIPSSPVKQAPAHQFTFDAKGDELQHLTTAYLSGTWAAFLEVAQPIVHDAKAACVAEAKNDKALIGVRCIGTEDFVLLMWMGTIPTSTDPSVFWAVIGPTPQADPYPRILPGLGEPGGAKLWELVVTDKPMIEVASYYVSKPVPDPLFTQIADVTAKFTDVLFATLDRAGGAPGPWMATVVQPTVPKKLLAVLRPVPLPEPRSGIEATLRLSVPIAPEDFSQSVTKLSKRLAAEGVGTLENLPAALKVVLEAFTKVHEKECAQKGVDDCKLAMHEIITKAVPPVSTTHTPAFLEARKRLEDALRLFVDGLKPTVATGKAALDNAPLSHLTFGLVAAYAARVFGDDQRAKLTGNKVTADPLSRSLLMVVLNWSPGGFQSKSTKRWDRRAFFRPFVGVVYKPDIGVAAGASFMLLSNLGLNVGYAHLFITQPEAELVLGADLDEKLTDAEGNATDTFRYNEELRHDPLRLGKRAAMFLGLSYNFK